MSEEIHDDSSLDESNNIKKLSKDVENLSLKDTINKDNNNNNETSVDSDIENDKTKDGESTNKMKKFNNVADLRKEMSKLGLSLKGNKDELKKRYKKYIKKQEEKEKNSNKVHQTPQPFKYYCVIDYEATCEEGGGLDYPNEIIEFPAVLLRSWTNAIIDEFHEYVKPVNQPILTQYCKDLTGITQEQVDKADYFPEVLERFERWLSLYSEFPYQNICFVTDGPWDIRDFIRKQCVVSQIERPIYFYKWNNLRKTFKHFYKLDNQKRLNEMLEYLGMTFEGHEHCGLDDTRNITRIVQCMLASKCYFKHNMEYPLSQKQ